MKGVRMAAFKQFSFYSQDKHNRGNGTTVELPTLFGSILGGFWNAIMPATHAENVPVCLRLSITDYGA